MPAHEALNVYLLNELTEINIILLSSNCKSVYTGTIPVPASNKINDLLIILPAKAPYTIHTQSGDGSSLDFQATFSSDIEIR